jgi:hypothetical protein
MGDESEHLRLLVENRLKERGIISFVGPFTAKVGDTPYFVLSSYGIKAEGEPPYNGSPHRFGSAELAAAAFFVELDKLLDSEQPAQFAWRRFPAFSEGDIKDIFVTARFALLGKQRLADAA